MRWGHEVSHIVMILFYLKNDKIGLISKIVLEPVPCFRESSAKNSLANTDLPIENERIKKYSQILNT